MYICIPTLPSLHLHPFCTWGTIISQLIIINCFFKAFSKQIYNIFLSYLLKWEDFLLSTVTVNLLKYLLVLPLLYKQSYFKMSNWVLGNCICNSYTIFWPFNHQTMYSLIEKIIGRLLHKGIQFCLQWIWKANKSGTFLTIRLVI